MRFVLVSFFATWILGCSPDFEPYNKVADFRLLAMASDKPDVKTGETATLSALVSEAGATYEWRWCPFSSGGRQGFECQVEDAGLQALLQGALGADAFTVPPLLLGNTPTVEFLNEMSPEAGRKLCDALTEFFPEGAAVPECLGDYFRYTILLTVTSADGSKSIDGARRLNVVLNSDVSVNTNPTFTDVEIGILDETVTSPILADGTTTIAKGKSYQLVANAQENQSQVYFETNRGETPDPTNEDLVLTWFSEVGELDRTRTSYLLDERPIEQLNQNEWSLTVEDDPVGPTKLWMVLRDERGGTSWQERTVTVEAGQ